MAGEPQHDNMVGKPLFDILSKLPTKSLLRFRCVSKLWCEYIDDSYFASVHDKQVTEDPTPIIFYRARNCKLEKTLFFHTMESDPLSNNVLKAKNKVEVLEFVGKKLLNETSRIVGSCNGLVLIETTDDWTPFTVIHPINKQCYVLPKFPLGCIRELCGLGFDSSTNTFKMVCVCFNRQYPDAQFTMVHVFGTDSWHTIPQVPAYRISGKAIYAHGCLHWLVENEFGQKGTRQVIWFDVKKEEYGLIKPPKTTSKPSKRRGNHPAGDHLVNLDGQVGYFGNETTEIWVLNHKREWVLHCNFEDHDFPDGFIMVLGCPNKAGDIIINVTSLLGKTLEFFYVYNLRNRVIYETHMDGLNLEDGQLMDIVMFPNSLLDIITNSNLFRKRA